MPKTTGSLLSLLAEIGSRVVDALFNTGAPKIGVKGLHDPKLARSVLHLQPGQYSLELIYEKVNPPSVEDLSIVLAELHKAGKLRRVYRVEEPGTHAGLGDFDALDEIPDEVPDRRNENTIRVEPSLVKPVFIVR